MLVIYFFHFLPDFGINWWLFSMKCIEVNWELRKIVQNDKKKMSENTLASNFSQRIALLETLHIPKDLVTCSNIRQLD